MPPKALIFDFFGVLCSEVAPPWFLERFPNDGLSLKQQFLESADKGTLSQPQLFAELSKLSGVASEDIEKDWIGRAHIDVELLEFIKTLKGTYKLGLLTNAMSSYFHDVTKELGLNELFDAIVISSEIGYAKPEPKAFQEILKRLEVSASETLLIDDNPINIQAAERLGMKGNVFTTTEELKGILQ